MDNVEKPLKSKPHRRFSTVMMATIISLVTISIVITLGVLNRHFSRRVETEFDKKLQAQKGQVEILVRNRVTNVQDSLKDLSSDNTIRVTVMLGAASQMEERLSESYPAFNGVYYFVQKSGELNITPEDYPKLRVELIHSVLKRFPRGELIEDGEKARLLWLFSSPIMHGEDRMGTAYALYDLTEDLRLFASIRKSVEGDVTILSSGNLISLTSGQKLPFEGQKLRIKSESTGFETFDTHFAISKISGFRDLYFVSSLKSLNEDKRRVTVLMGAFSALVLAFSTLISIFIGRKMVRPLREMTSKAIQISEGQKELRFESNGTYWEFDQLSQAFNYMLSALEEAEESSRYKELLENVDDAVYINDEKGKILDANVAAYSSLGYAAAVFFGLELNDLLPAEDAKRIVEQLKDRPENPTPKKLILETFHYAEDGARVPVEIYSRPIEYKGRHVILNVARDISERVEMEMALRESEEKYRSVVENSSDGIMILDTDFKILYANKVASTILGYTVAELGNSKLTRFLSKEYLDLPVASSFRQEAAEDVNTPNFYHIVRKNGEPRSVRINTNRFKDSKGVERIVAQIVDITDKLRAEEEKKQLEAQLIHAQKMEAIGTLAGGIAHDFNNLLMGVQGRLSLIRLDSSPDQPHYGHIDPIEKTIKSAANLIKQLLGFARKGTYEVKPTDINTLVEDSTRMFISSQKKVKLSVNCDKDVRPVRVDRGQIEQVLINLYVNAAQAMPEGGDLSVETGNEKLDLEFCRPYDVPPGDYVKITVTDTGIGMDAQTMSRIFEPFFTTKPSGKGTGLGLASAYGIVNNHKGIIKVKSTKGRGTTFTIYLPAIWSAADGTTVESAELVRGEGTIMIVDDEEESVASEEAMLKELGYRVLKASNGEDAIKIYRENKDELDLIALDMIMPGISGKETFERLKKINQDIKVLLLTGYSKHNQVNEIMKQGCSGLLQKPIDIVSLSRKIDKILNK